MAILKIDITIFSVREKKFWRHYFVHMFLNQISVPPYLICGIAILTVGEAGLCWIVPAIIFSFIKAIIDACVYLLKFIGSIPSNNVFYD